MLLVLLGLLNQVVLLRGEQQNHLPSRGHRRVILLLVKMPPKVGRIALLTPLVIGVAAIILGKLLLQDSTRVITLAIRRKATRA